MHRFVALSLILASSSLGAQAQPAANPSPTPPAEVRRTDNVDCAENQNNYLRIVYGKDGHMFIASMDLNLSFPVDKYLDSFAAVNTLLAKRGIRLVMVPIAHKGIVDAAFLDKANPLEAKYDPAVARSQYVKLVAGLKARGVTVVDSLPLLEKNVPAFFRSDWHWRPQAAKAVALEVAKTLGGLSILRAVPTVAFKPGLEEPFTLIDGSAFLANRIQELCKVKLASRDSLTVYHTDRVSAPGLLDDDAPQIVLAGSSYSKLLWNFDGFIKEGVQKDLLNVSVVGGGVHGALLSYLLGDTYAQNKPRAIVWEFDMSRFNDTPEDASSWMQLLAVLRADCTTPRAVYSGTLKNLLAGVQVGKVAKDYLKVDFEDLSILRYNVKSRLGNQDNPAQFVVRYNTPNEKGRYIFEAPALDYLKLDIVGTGHKPDSKVTVSTCSST